MTPNLGQQTLDTINILIINIINEQPMMKWGFYAPFP